MNYTAQFIFCFKYYVITTCTLSGIPKEVACVDGINKVCCCLLQYVYHILILCIATGWILQIEIFSVVGYPFSLFTFQNPKYKKVTQMTPSKLHRCAWWWRVIEWGHGPHPVWKQSILIVNNHWQSTISNTGY